MRPRARAACRSGARSSSAVAAPRRARSSASPARTGRRRPRELLGAMFRAAGRPVAVAGNVGRAAARARRRARAGTWIVCELSSFQLEDVETLRPRVAVLLNLEPDHLDRHGTFEAYRAAKLRIFENQGAGRRAVVPRGFGAVPARRAASSSPQTTRCRPSRASPARTTARTRPPRPRPRAPPGSPTTRSPRRCAPFPGVPHRLELVARARRRPLRQRLEGDEPGRRAAGARGVRRAAPADPRRLAQGRGLHGARGDAPGNVRVALPDRRDGRELAPALDAPGVAFARCGDARPRPSRGRRRGAQPGDVVLLSPGVRELRPVPRLRGARRRVPAPRRGARVTAAARRRSAGRAAGRARVPAARPRHARPRRLRPRDGLQRDLGARPPSADGDPMYFLKRQASTRVLGLVALRVLRARSTTARCARLRRRCSSCCARPPASLVLVAAPRVNGARRWLAVGPLDVPAVGAREARARDLGRRVPRAPQRRRGPSASSCGRSASSPASSRCCSSLEPDLGTAIAIVLMLAGDAARRRRAGAALVARRRRSSSPLGAARDLARAVPPRAPLQLPRPVAATRRAPATRSCRR